MSDKKYALFSLIWDVVAIALAATAEILTEGALTGFFGVLVVLIVWLALIKVIATAAILAFVTRKPKWILAFGLSCALMTAVMTQYHGPMADFFLYSPLVVDAAFMIRKIMQKE